MAHKCQDQAKGLQGFNLKVNYILQLKEAHQNHCAAYNIKMLWVCQPKDTQQFIDQLDNSKGRCKGNVRLTCVECNAKRGSQLSTLKCAIRMQYCVTRDHKQLLTDKPVSQYCITRFM